MKRSQGQQPSPLTAAVAKLARRASDGDIKAVKNILALDAPVAFSAASRVVAENEYAARAFMKCLWELTKEGKISEETKTLIAPAIASLLHHQYQINGRTPHTVSHYAREDAIRLLLLFSQKTGAESLIHPDVFRIDNPDITELLRSLNNISFVLKGDIRPWLDEIRPMAAADEHPYPSIYGELLRSLAIQHHPDTLRCIHDVETNFGIYNWAQEYAAAASCLLNGLSPDYIEEVLNAAEAMGREALPESVQYYVAAAEMKAWFACGVEQYMEQEGDKAAFAMKSLRAVGAPWHAWILEKAIQAFGPAGVPAEFSSRVALMQRDSGRLFDTIRNLRPPDDLEQPELEVVCHRYAAAHADELQKLLLRASPAPIPKV